MQVVSGKVRLSLNCSLSRAALSSVTKTLVALPPPLSSRGGSSRPAATRSLSLYNVCFAAGAERKSTFSLYQARERDGPLLYRVWRVNSPRPSYCRLSALSPPLPHAIQPD
jgi:hypothetical protein